MVEPLMHLAGEKGVARRFRQIQLADPALRAGMNQVDVQPDEALRRVELGHDVARIRWDGRQGSKR